MSTPPRKAKKEPPPPMGNTWESRRGRWRPEFQKLAEGPMNTAATRRANAQAKQEYNEWRLAKKEGRPTRARNNNLFETRPIMYITKPSVEWNAFPEIPVSPLGRRPTQPNNPKAPKRQRPSNGGGTRRKTRRAKVDGA